MRSYQNCDGAAQTLSPEQHARYVYVHRRDQRLYRLARATGREGAFTADRLELAMMPLYLVTWKIVAD